MITKIYVDGFRSLTNFKMSINPGINMLVGPNGSGKTNIILFFEFLSQLISNPLSEAVSRCGGAGTIFTRINEDEFSDSITVKIAGSFGNATTSRFQFVYYEYDFQISISEDRDFIYFKTQDIRLSSGSSKRRSSSFDFDIRAFVSDPEEKGYNIKIV